MTMTRNRMAEQHIIEDNARALHFMEEPVHINASAAKPTAGPEAIRDASGCRVRLGDSACPSSSDWCRVAIDYAGPMGVWDVLAQDLEVLLERIERKAPTAA